MKSEVLHVLCTYLYAYIRSSTIACVHSCRSFYNVVVPMLSCTMKCSLNIGKSNNFINNSPTGEGGGRSRERERDHASIQKCIVFLLNGRMTYTQTAHFHFDDATVFIIFIHYNSFFYMIFFLCRFITMQNSFQPPTLVCVSTIGPTFNFVIPCLVTAAATRIASACTIFVGLSCHLH